jgi:hypothetical protein
VPTRKSICEPIFDQQIPSGDLNGVRAVAPADRC